MKFKISKKKSLLFSKLAKDKNKIHLDNNFARNFFFKEPILHGVNVFLTLFLILYKNKKKEVKSCRINFLNYCIANEMLFLKKNKLISLKNEKLNFTIKFYKDISYLKEKNIYKKNNFFFKNKNFFHSKYIAHLIKISGFIGTKFPGNGSLIHSIESHENKENKKYVFKKRRISGTVYQITYGSDGYLSNIVSSKLKKFKLDKLSFKKYSILEKKRGNKILIIGSSGDIGNYLKKLFKKNNLNFDEYNFRITLDKKKVYSKILKNLITKIKSNDYKYIFYLSSPNIIKDQKKRNINLFNSYKLVYFIFVKDLLKLIKKNDIQTKIFYPSSFVLNKPNSYPQLKSYMQAKQLGERLSFLSRSSSLKIYRLPQIQSRSNYNFFGIYEGKSPHTLDRLILDFFKD